MKSVVVVIDVQYPLLGQPMLTKLKKQFANTKNFTASDH